MKHIWLAKATLLLGLISCPAIWAQERTQPTPSQPDRTRTTEPTQPSARRAEPTPRETTRPSEPSSEERTRSSETTRPQGRSAAPIATHVDETPVVTHHKIEVGGKTLEYTTTVAQMPINDASGETEAHICYFAYTLDNSDPKKRPLTFAFNGGPGSASIWVHMGAMGPRKSVLLDNGDMPPPPFQVADNPNTWLEETDLVFIDPVGTGYSRAKSTDIARRMNGVQGDIQSVAEFIRMYLTRNNRWMSPLFIAGESYGTFRAAGLAGNLVEQGIAVNGVVLISTILNYGTGRGGLINNTPYALYLPTFTADAWYHKRLPADLQKDLGATLKEVEAWAMTGYLEALNKGDTLSEDERAAVVAKLARYTGLQPTYLDNSNLRLDVNRFARELLRDKKLTIGRYDGRLTGPSPLNAGDSAEFDPSGSLPRPPFTAAFMQYITSELGYKTDMNYYVLGGGIMPWDWGTENNYVDTTAALRDAFTKNPHLKVMVCAGYFDLATPYFAAEYTLNHMGVHPETQKSINWRFYEAGHMMYIDKACHAKLKHDIAEFIHSATAQ
jgi:carboxypeptidase C (cathepsin A)